MRFLVDTQLPRALALWFRERGHDADRVLDLSLAQGKDTAIWQNAADARAVVVAKDEDFAKWVRRGRIGPSVVWLRVGNCSRRVLLSWLEPLLADILHQLDQGERLVEVR